MIKPLRWISLAMLIALALGLISGGAPAQAQETGRPFIGVYIEQTAAGARVIEVTPDSPAAEAGLLVGDLITAVDGESVGGAVTTAEPPLVAAVLAHAPGDVITLTVLRDDEEREVTLTLGTAPEDTDKATEEVLPEMPGREANAIPLPFARGLSLLDKNPGYLGLQYVTITPDNLAALAGSAEAPVATPEDVKDGALVIEVQEGTPAAEAGLQAGDVITAVENELVDAERELGDRLYAYEPGDTVTLTVLRGEETFDVEVTLVERPVSMSSFVARLPMMNRMHRGMFGRGMMGAPESSFSIFRDEDGLHFSLPGARQEVTIPNEALTDPNFDWEAFLADNPALQAFMQHGGMMMTPEHLRQMFPRLNIPMPPVPAAPAAQPARPETSA